MDKNSKKPIEQSDEELVLCIRNGGSNDLSELLVKRYMSIVRIKALTYTKSCPAVEYDDLYSEGLIGLLKAIRYYDSKKGASFATFASLCIDTSMKTCITKTLKNSNLSKQDDFDWEAIPDTAELTEDIVIVKEQDGELYEKLSDILTKREMAVLDMYLRHYTYQQIADELSVNEKSVDNALHRAKSKIKSNLGK